MSASPHILRQSLKQGLKQCLLALLVMSLLSACGWHFRGAMNVELAIKQLSIVDNAGDGLLQQVLRQKLSQVGVVVLSSREGVPSLTLYQAQKTRKALTLVAGNVEEYELKYRVMFDVKQESGEVVLPGQEIEISRVYSYDAGQVLAKEREQLRLYQEMRHEAVTALLYRLQSVQVEATAEAEPE